MVYIYPVRQKGNGGRRRLGVWLAGWLDTLPCPPEDLFTARKRRSHAAAFTDGWVVDYMGRYVGGLYLYTEIALS